MHQIGTVQVVECLSNLVDDVSLVLLPKDVLAYQGVQVDVHVLENQVNVLVVVGFYYLLHHDDVGVAELLQEHDLPVRSLGVSGVLKGIEIFLQGVHCLLLSIHHLPHVTICPTAYFLDGLVAHQDMLVYLLGHLPIFLFAYINITTTIIILPAWITNNQTHKTVTSGGYSETQLHSQVACPLLELDDVHFVPFGPPAHLPLDFTFLPLTGLSVVAEVLQVEFTKFAIPLRVEYLDGVLHYLYALGDPFPEQVDRLLEFYYAELVFYADIGNFFQLGCCQLREFVKGGGDFIPVVFDG